MKANMRRLKPEFLLTALIILSATAHAAKPELQIGGGLGGGLGRDTHRIGILCFGRFRLLPEVPVAVEVSAYLPFGAGAGLVLDVYRNEYLRVHFLDLGVFVPFDASLRVMHPEVRRGWDFTVGAGIEWFDRANGIAITLDWRAFLPDPTTVPFHYGGFAKKFYIDALIGGQLWVGFARRF